LLNNLAIQTVRIKMRKLACEGKVQYWALGVSVAIHAVALGVFTGVQLSNPSSNESEEKSVSMRMVETVLEKPVAKPKPKVETIQRIEPKPPVKSEQKPLIAEKKEPVVIKPVTESVVAELKPHVAEPVIHEVEFFGQKGIAQRICYVVDCSGSMYGQMYSVKNKLKESILKLNSKQAFCVLFFMDGKQLQMTGAGKLEAATITAKSQAQALIEAVKPAGSTDAIHALECAMRLRDKEGHCPETIYFLTDGFDLDESGRLFFVETVERLRESFAPSVVLRTIGFWPQNEDRKMLKTLALNTGGRYTEAQ
jgi:hypothetical protein